jgi:hypothetical protein
MAAATIALSDFVNRKYLGAKGPAGMVLAAIYALISHSPAQ